jgi:hypothetical protein
MSQMARNGGTTCIGTNVCELMERIARELPGEPPLQAA